MQFQMVCLASLELKKDSYDDSTGSGDGDGRFGTSPLGV